MRLPILFSLLFLTLGACSDERPLATSTGVDQAIAIMHPTEGNSVKGVVYFTKVDEGIQVIADIQGLTPGKHGFHIHEFGDCSAPDATSAGGHYNPQDKPHAGPDAQERHVGDLGNIVAEENGQAHYERLDKVISFGKKNNVLGRAVVIHANPDDLSSPPTGNAGDRVACGVIGLKKR